MYVFIQAGYQCVLSVSIGPTLAKQTRAVVCRSPPLFAEKKRERGYELFISKFKRRKIPHASSFHSSSDCLNLFHFRYLSDESQLLDITQQKRNIIQIINSNVNTVVEV
ncbi:hypothetical protein K1T71_001260 [Dendrolimus kikuchii]|uniref:Uncharacterized protein n=1 Tax=Dendrolimus kikuchii TaxID=765133 RepID=A0ACC1DH44_9NEOP|nr:hypothetical protein K1T71_001260 [Dendrolimus kikuchii]